MSYTQLNEEEPSEPLAPPAYLGVFQEMNGGNEIPNCNPPAYSLSNPQPPFMQPIATDIVAEVQVVPLRDSSDLPKIYILALCIL